MPWVLAKLKPWLRKKQILICSERERKTLLGRGPGQVVSMVILYSNDPSSNPAEA